MRTGFVVDMAHWDTVVHGLPDGLVSIEWACHSGAEALDFLRLGGIGLVVVEATDRFLTPEVVGHADTAGIPIAALITSPGGEEVATELGVGHRLRQPEDLAALASKLQHAGQEVSPDVGHNPEPSPSTAEALAGEGIVRVFYGPHGAPGVTTLCLTQASVLSRQGLRVCVVDADARGGVVSVALGLTDEIPGFLAAVRLAGKDQLTAAELERLGSTYQVPPVNYPVFTSTPRPLARGEAARDSVDRFFELAKRHFDVVVVDAGCGALGGARPEETPSAHQELASHLLWRADDVVVVAGASMTGVARLARMLPDIHRHAGSTPVRVWLNGLDASRRASGEDAALREALWRHASLSDFAVVARDDATARQALRHAVAVPEAHPSSPIVQAVSTESTTLISRIRAVAQRSEAVPKPTSAQPALATSGGGRGRQSRRMVGLGKALAAKWDQLTALR